MEVTKVTCDECGADLTSTGNSVDYRLALVVQRVPVRGGFVTDVGRYPPVERNHHFCGLPCLDLWSDRRRLRATVIAKHVAAWHEAHGTKTAGGATYGDMPPDEVRKQWADDADAQARALKLHNKSSLP